MVDADISGMLEARYQPIVRLLDRKPVGLEVLARLRHPSEGLIFPDAFIPELERTGRAPELIRAIAARAFADCGRPFLDRHGLFLTLNLPLPLVLSERALAWLDARRASAGLSPSHVIIELTESIAPVDLGGLQDAVRRWRRAGYRLAIDDVGPDVPRAFSLFKLPFTSMKLDKGLLHRAFAERATLDHVRALIAAARAEKLAIVAEGVETPAMWAMLDRLGVDHAQGFMIAEPLCAGALTDWLDRWRSPDDPPHEGSDRPVWTH